MKKYVFAKYDEVFGTGDDQIFSTESEAVKAAEKDWDNMCFSDKRRFLNNSISEFRVFEIEIEIEDALEDEILASFETKEIWNTRDV